MSVNMHIHAMYMLLTIIIIYRWSSKLIIIYFCYYNMVMVSICNDDDHYLIDFFVRHIGTDQPYAVVHFLRIADLFECFSGLCQQTSAFDTHLIG